MPRTLYRIPKAILKQVMPLAKNLTKKNHKETLDKIHSILETQGYADSTKSVNYSKVKKLFKDYTKDVNFLIEIRPDPIITAKLFEHAKKRLKNVKNIDINENIITKILSFRNSKRNVFELFIFLLFVTGRRVSEIKNSDILMKPRSKNMIISHTLKRNDKNQYLSFPTVVSPKVVHQVLDDFKTAYLYTNEDTFSNNLNKKIKKLFGNEFHAHVLRKMYAVYMYKFRNDEKLTINPFVQKILLQQSLTSSFFYTGINYTFDKDIAKKI